MEAKDYEHDGWKATIALNAALAEAQGQMATISKSSEAKIESKTGASYSYTYAPLDVIWADVRPILAANGLAVVQLLEPGPALRTELRHKAGGVLGSSFPFNAPESPKALGSMLTYLRRYALMAMLGLATADDDGSAADGTKPTEPVEMISQAQHRKIGVLLKELEEAAPRHEGQLSWVAQLREDSRVESRKDMTRQQASDAIEWLEKQKADVEVPM